MGNELEKKGSTFFFSGGGGGVQKEVFPLFDLKLSY